MNSLLADIDDQLAVEMSHSSDRDPFSESSDGLTASDDFSEPSPSASDAENMRLLPDISKPSPSASDAEIMRLLPDIRDRSESKREVRLSLVRLSEDAKELERMMVGENVQNSHMAKTKYLDKIGKKS